MESEFERILKREKKVSAATTGVLLFIGVAMLIFGWYLEVALSFGNTGYKSQSPPIFLILAAYCFIGYYRLRQSRVNVELTKAIRDIRERLDQGAKEENV